MKAHKISVLMPVYNTKEEYLREAIESILNQTFTDFEFIICDDGSTKNIAQIVQFYSDNRIRFIRNNKNLGGSMTRNKLMQQAMGEYVAWMDSDDISLPNRLEKQYAFLEKHSDISVVGAWYERFPENSCPHLPERVGLIDMLKWNALAQPVAMYRRKDFEQKNLKCLSDFVVAEDYDLWIRTLMAGLKLANIQEVLLKYRWHPSNISNQKQTQMEASTQKVQDTLIRALSGDSQIQEKLVHLFDQTNKKVKENFPISV